MTPFMISLRPGKMRKNEFMVSEVMSYNLVAVMPGHDTGNMGNPSEFGAPFQVLVT